MESYNHFSLSIQAEDHFVAEALEIMAQASSPIKFHEELRSRREARLKDLLRQFKYAGREIANYPDVFPDDDEGIKWACARSLFRNLSLEDLIALVRSFAPPNRPSRSPPSPHNSYLPTLRPQPNDTPPPDKDEPPSVCDGQNDGHLSRNTEDVNPPRAQRTKKHNGKDVKDGAKAAKKERTPERLRSRLARNGAITKIHAVTKRRVPRPRKS